MTQTTATTAASVQYCHDLVLGTSKEGILDELVSFLKELKARHSFGFLWRAQRLKQGNVPILRIWTRHTSKGDAETDLFNLGYQLAWQDISMIMVAKAREEFELDEGRHGDMALGIIGL